MPVHRHRVLHSRFQQFVFVVRADRDGAMALAGHFAAVDVFPWHASSCEGAGILTRFKPHRAGEGYEYIVALADNLKCEATTNLEKLLHAWGGLLCKKGARTGT